MVKIFNIKLVDNIISCDYTPENSDLKGHIEVNTDTEEIQRITYSDYPLGKNMYISQTRQKLIAIYKEGKPFPKQAFSVWY